MTPKAYCKAHGLSGGAFARKVGISETYAWRLLAKERKVSYAMALKIEKKTKGEITRYDLRPDFFGRRPKGEAADNNGDSIANLSLTGQGEQTAPAMQAAEAEKL